jgi:ACS family hexuronate transporter-like MFS transporter
MAIHRSRKLVMLICSILVLPIIVASRAASVWPAVALIGLAAAAHQGWAANMFTLPSDMFPKRVVGSVMGIGGMAGSVGSMVFSASAGFILEWTGSYLSLFIMSGLAYLIALGLMQLLTAKAKPVEF